ncbi:Por secretion system C-terminal sorting domain-containing protein [Mariniphaga anaerophila]|uniref:Por secretion system C-terminal sorting domain-containing protein n=1 Tax=Mariniphaga anaerophila TaxID=1484053 RepID=A0A1M4SLL9_9BACT|nr:T9SS type A sorting domain-containing protein [Mariniphaga anaerophila]SHE33052.1 Por secretion system C-terminal sorting domain-containing protein [Mariniphaga anaerophila]
MKLKLLLLSFLLTGILNAQEDTIRTLIITETRVDRNDQSYVEITNVGTEDINMSQFEFGRIGAWTQPYEAESGSFLRLPDRVLAPGETFLIASVKEFTEEMYPLQPDFFRRRDTKKEWWTLADIQMHMPEERTSLAPAGITDSVSTNYAVMETWGSREAWYIEQHFANGDSAIVDQVGGLFAADDGTQEDSPTIDVAGVTNAWGTHILVRKASVKQGTTDFNSARGIDIEDSEWIPLPIQSVGTDSFDPWRALFWTVGFHGDVTLDESTLVSDALTVDWANKTITAAWGTRNNDDFMFEFEKVPGLAWKYDLAEAAEDSAYNSARTGDKLTIYACGNTLQTTVFDIIVEAPTTSANIVIPKFSRDWDTEGNFYTNAINSGIDEVFEVTVDVPEMDTITNGLFGIQFATRTDTLFKYLEKAPNAQWEIIWVDGIERPDVKNGDILKVTAENGAIKEYFIKTDIYRADHNANLAAITWPDIPEWMKGLFGWTGDTIPGFDPNVLNYTVEVPAETSGIPSLIAKAQELNTTVEVQGASSLSGSDAQKTVKYTVTAEDDTTVNVYNVKLEKEISPDDIQPFETEPFFSEVIFNEQWSNGFIEICNPGNQVLDLSDYMMVGTYSDQAGAITQYSGEDDWAVRYRKYIPGYKWVDESTWAAKPGTLVEDFNVSPRVEAGDVFVMGHINGTGQSGYPWNASRQCDIIFNTAYNPWGEAFDEWASAANEWNAANYYIFKILNDSIKRGLKPADDPNDFELIDVFGQGDETQWVVGGVSVEQITSYVRKPEYWQGKTGFGESFGTNEDDAEWTWTNRAYWGARGYGWPDDILMVTSDLGKHFFYPVTTFQSTISSVVYKVSDGYKTESLRGVVAGTTVAEFLGNIIKKNEEQNLTVKATADGSQLADGDMLSLSDTLVVVSADGTNTTKYVLNVSEEGLSSDALLTSTLYTVMVETQPAIDGSEGGEGYVTGFDYGTQLRTILNNVTVPDGALLSVVDGDGAYVSLKRLNYDTSYVNVTVNTNTYLNVVAENGITEIVYQLRPTSSENDAFILSDIYMVSQSENLVRYVPRETNVYTLLSNVVPSLNATIKVIDKLGNERMEGAVYEDDKIVVTSPSGTTTRVYHLAMLRTELVPAPVYLAYVLSNVYSVNQISYAISGIPGGVALSEFYSRITPSWGATAVVVDANGDEKTSGNLNAGDMLKVTSADGKIEVIYQLGMTSAFDVAAKQIEIYPNPTAGKLNVSGVDKGDRIQVYSSTGAIVEDIKVSRNLEVLSLDRQPAGMYVIVISSEKELIGRFKAIKK